MTSIGQETGAQERGAQPPAPALGLQSRVGLSVLSQVLKAEATHIVHTRCSCVDTPSHHPVLAMRQGGAAPLRLRHLPEHVAY